MLVSTRFNPQQLARFTTLCWLGLLVFLTTLPRTPYVPFVPTESLGSLAHFGTHLMLAALVYLAMRRPAGLDARAGLALLALLSSAALGLAIEGIQSFLPTRDASQADFIFATAGAATGAAVVLLLDWLRLNRRYLSVATFTMAVALLLGTGASVLTWDPALPRAGDHWHAIYRIVICGTRLPPLEGGPGSVHTHGDGFIHIHPNKRAEAGRNATLSRFLATHGGTLTNEQLTLPDGATYRNGDRCGDGGTGELLVTVNGTRIELPAAYVLRDRDSVRIEFRSSNAGSTRL